MNNHIYVSFGSMAKLEVDQIEELYWGLKRYNDKFLWMVRESEQTKQMLSMLWIFGELESRFWLMRKELFDEK